MTERFLLVLLMLLGASWSDLQTRRVRNRYWLPFIAAAALLWAGDLAAGVPQVAMRAAWAAGLTALFYGLWHIGTFGGADAKGMMVMAWLWPGVPDLLAARTVPVLDTLVNATFLAVGLPLAFLLWNVLRGDVRFPAALLGTRMPLATARSRHVWPMQRLDASGRMHWKYWQRPGEPLDAVYGRLQVAGVDRVWATPKIPFMVLLTAGSVGAWSLGNGVLKALLAA